MNQGNCQQSKGVPSRAVSEMFPFLCQCWTSSRVLCVVWNVTTRIYPAFVRLLGLQSSCSITQCSGSVVLGHLEGDHTLETLSRLPELGAHLQPEFHMNEALPRAKGGVKLGKG